MKLGVHGWQKYADAEPGSIFPLIPAKSTSTVLLEIRELFNLFVGMSDKVILCLDGIDYLNKSREFDDLVFFLRSILDQNRDKIRVLHIGSDRDCLRELFFSHKAAFYLSATKVELPALGNDFIEHMRSSFNKTSGKSFCLSSGIEAFNLLDRAPGKFRLLLARMVFKKKVNIVEEANLVNATKWNVIKRE